MKYTKVFTFCMVVVFLGLNVSAQITPPPPTAAVTRGHYSYNHFPPVGVYEHEDICVSVFVDQLSVGDEARIHFRLKSGLPFHMMTLGYNNADGCFAVCIDERYHENSSIDYYIELFPAGLTPIRLPENPGEFFNVKVKKKSSRYIEPILIAFLIFSPAFGAYLFTRLRKAHTKRRAEYENKLRARRRKLHKEREKHYKEYLKSLSGRKVAVPRSKVETRDEMVERGQPGGTPDTSNRVEETAGTPVKGGPPVIQPKQSPPKPNKVEMGDTDKELRRELDNILKTIPVPASPGRPLPQKPPQKPALNPAQKPPQKPALNPAQKPPQKPPQKPVLSPAQKPPQKPALNPAQKPVQKPAQPKPMPGKPSVKEPGKSGSFGVVGGEKSEDDESLNLLDIFDEE